MCQQLQGLIFCMICLVVIGPILIITGIVLLSSENNREVEVKKYNEAVADYAQYGPWVAKWSNVTARQSAIHPTASLAATTATVSVSGSQDGVDAATSNLRQGTVSAFGASPSGLAFTVDGFSTTKAFPWTKTSSSTIYCSSHSCSSYCSSAYDDVDRECNSDTLLLATCRANHNTGATFTRTRRYCDGSEDCGYCTYESYASELCGVVEVGNEGELSASNMISCKYPFTSSSGVYTATKPTGSSTTGYTGSVKIQLRASKDPDIVLEQMTQGSRDFGITADQQTSYGMTCLVLGCIITVVLCGLLILYCNRSNAQQQQQQQQQQEMQTHPAQPYNGVVVVGQPQQQQQPYGQPQPYSGQAYGQPANAPVGYPSQPNDPYNTNAGGPAYGQPGSAYGSQTQDYGSQPGSDGKEWKPQSVKSV